jgi:E3 SUMO-protein ligase PIAS1
MPQNRHTVRTNIILTTDVSTRMKADASLRLMLYCGSDPNQYSEIDVAFPNQLEVKINGDDVKANFKGLKNKPGSTKPTDITDKVRKSAGYSNQMCITYALTQKNYGFCVYLVKYNSADVLTERIKAGRHGGGIITKQQVLSEMKQANDDPDIAATSVRMSLKDPISTLRITLPVRSIVCTHNQCFDGAMFLQLQEQAPQWACPVCSKSVSYQSLCVDKYFEEILQQTPTSIEKVDIEPDGEWHVIKDESQPNGHSSRDQRASYDDDFDDDDVVEVPHPIPKSHGISLGKAGTPSHFSPSISSGYAMNTPPLSSRGPSTAPSTSSAHLSNKRPAPGVIDLTFSDDEDEPPRPAKRQSTHASTSTHPGTSTSTPQSYDTPNPPSNPRNPSYATSHGPVTDAYRASVNIARPSSGHSNTQGGSSGIGSRSPWRAEDSSSPSSYQMSNPWTTQSQSLPPVTLGSGQGQAFPPFTIRPPSASSSNVSPTGRQQPIRLPPLQPMNSYSRDPYTGWRSGSQNGYSNSPSGQ